MSITKNDLDAFHQFAQTKLEARGAETLQELVDIWEIERPSDEVRRQNVAAVNAALREMENGDTGQPAMNAVEELRREFSNRRE